jgi:hypothetical protein
MREFANEQAMKFFGQVWDDVLGYLRLYDYAKLKARSALGAKKALASPSAFWASILGDRFAGQDASGYLPLQDGDIVRFDDVFLTEWAPKLPGRIWTVDGVVDFAEGQKRVHRYEQFGEKVYAVLDPYGKSRVVAAGFGTIRVRQGLGDADNYMYMSLTDEKDWSCDRGVPVVVSRSVYEEYKRYAANGAPWLKHIEGVLHVNQDLPFREIIPPAIGCALSPEAEATLRYRPHLPKCFMHVTSPLSVAFTHNDSHPRATAWTMFRTRRREEPLRYTYTAFDPSSKESIREAVKFLEWYMGEYGGKECITDFDGQTPRLASAIPPVDDPIRRKKKHVAAWIRSCDQWASDTLQHLDHH